MTTRRRAILATVAWTGLVVLLALGVTSGPARAATEGPRSTFTTADGAVIVSHTPGGQHYVYGFSVSSESPIASIRGRWSTGVNGVVTASNRADIYGDCNEARTRCDWEVLVHRLEPGTPFPSPGVWRISVTAVTADGVIEDPPASITVIVL